MTDIAIEFPREDVRRLFGQMDRAQKELGKSLGQTVRFAAWSIASSLGKVTRVAKKHRPYKEIKEAGSVVRAKGGKKYKVTSYRSGGRKTFNVRAASVAELKRSSKVLIGKAGLAKASWFWGIKKIGGGRNISQAGVTKTAKRFAALNMDVENRTTGDDPYVKMVNSIPYIRAAMLGGESAITGAMGRAARHMERITDANLDKKLRSA